MPFFSVKEEIYSENDLMKHLKSVRPIILHSYEQKRKQTSVKLTIIFYFSTITELDLPCR